MNPEVDELKRVLAAERERTEARLASLERSFADVVAYSAGSPPDDEHDPEGATVGWERAQLSALQDQAREYLRELDLASARLTEGTYDRCEQCAGHIEAERLAARPATRLCVACASRS